MFCMLCNLTLVANWCETLDTLGQYAMGALERRRSVFASQLSGNTKISFVFHTPLFSARHNSSELGSALAYRKGSYFIRHFSALGNLKFIWIALAYRKGSVSFRSQIEKNRSYTMISNMCFSDSSCLSGATSTFP